MQYTHPTSSAQHPSWARIETHLILTIKHLACSAQHPSWARIETIANDIRLTTLEVAPSIQAGRGLKPSGRIYCLRCCTSSAQHPSWARIETWACLIFIYAQNSSARRRSRVKIEIVDYSKKGHVFYSNLI